MKYTPLYLYSYEVAKRDQEVSDWRASYNENVRCKTYIDKQIAKRFDGMRLDGDLVKDVCEVFGIRIKSTFQLLLAITAETMKAPKKPLPFVQG